MASTDKVGDDSQKMLARVSEQEEEIHGGSRCIWNH